MLCAVLAFEPSLEGKTGFRDVETWQGYRRNRHFVCGQLEKRRGLEADAGLGPWEWTVHWAECADRRLGYPDHRKAQAGLATLVPGCDGRRDFVVDSVQLGDRRDAEGGTERQS